MNKLGKKSLTLAIVSVILFESISVSFADNNYNDLSSDLSYYSTSKDSLVIDNNKIDIIENDNTRTSKITDLKTGKENQIIYYKNENKVYSSYTDKTFDVENSNADINDNLSFYSGGKDYTDVSYADVKYSYKELAAYGGGLVGIAAGIIATLGGLGLEVPSVVKVLQGVGTTIMGAVTMSQPSSKHGIVLHVKREKVYRDGDLYDLKGYILNAKTY